MNEFHRYLETDPEYLLRTALTHDWDAAAAFCERILMLTTTTKEEDDQQDGDDTSPTVHLCRRQLQACDQYGNSVLQAACYYRPPLFCIERILEAAFACGCRSRLLRHTAVDQSTALQVACATGADGKILELLLSSEGDDCLGWRDQQGSTPVSELVVQYTLERQGPFHVRRSRPLEDVMDVEIEREESPIFRVFWAKLELLLRVAYRVHDDDKEDGFTMLAGAAAVASTCPPVLTSLLLRHHFNSTTTTAGVTDYTMGRLLLVAVERQPAPDHAVLQRQLYTFVSRLVDERLRQASHGSCSTATTTEQTDHLVVTTAIRRGQAWPLVDLLVSSHSNSLLVASTAEWPLFLQAATAASSTADKANNNNTLDTIYGLLRRLPQQALSAVVYGEAVV